jgi:hypothetical protein
LDAILELLRKYPSHANTELPNPRRRKKTGGELLADGLGRIADAVGPQQSWKEKTIELFWKDFGSEDMGFQMEAVDALNDEAVAISSRKMSIPKVVGE